MGWSRASIRLMKLKASQNLWKPLPPSQTLCLFASAARQQPLVCFDSLKMRANLSWSAIGCLNGQLKSNPRTKWWRQKLKFRRRLISLPHLWSSQLWQQIIMVYLWAAKWDNRSRCFQRSSRRDSETQMVIISAGCGRKQRDPLLPSGLGFMESSRSLWVLKSLHSGRSW